MPRLAANQATRSTIKKSKIDREELDALPFSSFWVDHDMLHRCAVPSGGSWIQHLQRIATRLKRPRKHAIDFLFRKRGRRRNFFGLLFTDWLSQSLSAGRGGERDQDGDRNYFHPIFPFRRRASSCP